MVPSIHLEWIKGRQRRISNLNICFFNNDSCCICVDYVWGVCIRERFRMRLSIFLFCTALVYNDDEFNEQLSLFNRLSFDHYCLKLNLLFFFDLTVAFQCS